jgi:hypothetical protein
MTIMINKDEVKSIEQFPDNIQTIIQLIPEGEKCLETMRDDTEHTLNFPSPDELIEQLNIGLRGSSLLYLPNVNLVADIKKLLELSNNDLRDLSYQEEKTALKSTMPDRLTGVREILKKYHLLDNNAFSKIIQFYKSNNITYHPLTWSADLNAQITLYETLIYCEQAFNHNHRSTTDAINWAMKQSQSLHEFASYYPIHLTWHKKTQGKSGGKLKDIDHLLETLSPIVLNNLDCPLVTFELDKMTLNLALEQWIDADNTLGFSDLSSGILNIVLNIDLTQPDNLLRLATQYIEQLQLQLKNTLAADSYINQAGQCRHYQFDLPNNTLLLNLNNVGCLSLHSDKPKIPNVSSNTLVKRS